MHCMQITVLHGGVASRSNDPRAPGSASAQANTEACSQTARAMHSRLALLLGYGNAVWERDFVILFRVPAFADFLGLL